MSRRADLVALRAVILADASLRAKAQGVVEGLLEALADADDDELVAAFVGDDGEELQLPELYTAADLRDRLRTTLEAIAHHDAQ